MILSSCSFKRHENSVLESTVNEPGIIQCIEAGSLTSSSWKSFIKFSPTGTSASIQIQYESQPPVYLRTSFDYRSIETPETFDEYSFPTDRHGSLVLTSRTGSNTSSAVWRSNNKTVLFDCATNQSGLTNVQANSEIMRCYEADEAAGWEMEVRLDHSILQQNTEVTLQKNGEAPNTRRAMLEALGASPGPYSNQFALVMSKAERFIFDLDSEIPKATWAHNGRTTSFVCPVNIAH